ncbi:efflux RND transporter permease subunit, partial [Bordetella holmesii]|uniref:efflux RND transporter permease subunit n=1 Tax=Bordetella holmesii TaxID=35814 RepID=UPI001A980A74
LSAPTRSAGALYDIGASILAQRLAQGSGVGEITLGGSSLPAVRVQINPTLAAHYGLALDDVRNAIDRAAPLGPQGTVE